MIDEEIRATAIKFAKQHKNRLAKTSKFADFFLHASDKKKIKVFTEAACKANDMQREIFLNSRAVSKVR